MIGKTALRASAFQQNPSCSFSFQSSNFNAIEQHIPDADTDLMPGIKWGNYCQLYTPAFWKYMYLWYDLPKDTNHHRLGENVIEEVAACLLGGYGMPAELGLAAFERLKSESLLLPGTCFSRIQNALSQPFKLKNGSQKRYRFYNQKSRYIYTFLLRDDLCSIPTYNDIAFRNWLLTVEGIGPKTASWITRNWLQSENVAILDIHILRAGRIAGFFEDQHDVSKEYFDLESCYINFCKALDVLPSNMDAIIWDYMKKTNKLALKVISYPK